MMPETASPSRQLVLGPSHPAVRGGFQLQLRLEGERIADAQLEIGYQHCGWEKAMESQTWQGVVPLIDCVVPAAPIIGEVGYCMAVEKLLALEVPERAVWIRMLACEVSRIAAHLGCVSRLFSVLGLPQAFSLFREAREGLLNWIELASGSRVHPHYARIGGVAFDLPPETPTRLPACLKALRAAITAMRHLTCGNRLYLDRVQGIGVLLEEDAKAFGVTGPALRAAGVTVDVRRQGAPLFYDALEWDVPIGLEGDAADRVAVRIEEMEQSARIIEQILTKMPRGPIMTPHHDKALPPKHEVYGTIEGMTRHFKICVEGIALPKGEVYAFTEAANGELGFSLISDGGVRPARIKVRSPSFALAQLLPKLLRGHMLADSAIIVASLDIVAAEMDR